VFKNVPLTPAYSQAQLFWSSIMKRQQTGQFLWELLIAIIIIGILMVYVAPKWFMWQGTARVMKVKEVESAMRTANLGIYARAVLLGIDHEPGPVSLNMADPNDGSSFPINIRYGYAGSTTDFIHLIDGVGTDVSPSPFWADGMSVRYANTPQIMGGGGPDSCGVEYMPPQGPMNPPNGMNPTYTLRVDGC
jgi:type II secretory pathway pseudopilin PulG